MKPVVVLVGRPNVGKSTLFNALTRSRQALVADLPGLTRDRQYGEGRVGGRSYLVVDTGGIVRDHDPLATLVASQTRLALAEADVVVCVVDGRDGPNPDDFLIADQIRTLNRRICLAVNKTEGVEPEVAVAEFHALGLGRPYAIAATHNRGLDELMTAVLAGFPAPTAEAPTGGMRIALAGRPNVGKSTLANALLGEERVVVSDRPGTTRDSIYIPFTRDGKDYILIDTAGVRRRSHITDPLERHSVAKTLQAVDEAQVVLLVFDAREEVSEQDVTLAGHILAQGRSLVLAVNKWEGLDSARRDWIRRELARRLPFLSFASPHFISALEGLHIGPLFPAMERAYRSGGRILPTPELNRVLREAIAATAPPMVRGRRIKPKFAHQGGKYPPRVIVHGNLVAETPDAWRRYLAQRIREHFRLEGTPVEIEFREGDNPFANRPGKAPSARTEAKRRRLKRFRKAHYG
ncbi:ribosome biogenesis GTPase Der [Acidiferrobacter thiooxydans]|jgi:GTP-binding protein|uniref:GTPase Der n=1 Tax=Acidiferrobacter thiooxydans TaxID=163359 RepID=A0A1C2FYR2_9GAMM|nr:ribosome biogenesis GTPase Der [Acidiferrobacter thiooxydans]MDA8192073.1 ribosome biogenesis GTPase Der [Gammaproteobacteria bacterium]RCN59157.1 ribosome biogenesis GTPase Der [Acidiferrobacter thiooxydans]UEO00882.1 ribosome biogenesis GTPase Der [Acidiferrobacter thiooxydans]